MKKNGIIVLIISLAINMSLSTVVKAQIKWGSDWKMFSKDYTFDMNYNDGQKLHSNYVRAVAVDKEGTAWIADVGILRTYKDFKYTTMGRKQYGSPQYINALLFDNQDNLWIGGSNGLYRYSNGNYEHIIVPELTNITEIAINKEGHIYVGGIKKGAEKGGLSVFDGTNWKNYNPENSDIPKSLVQSIAFDKEGNVWMTSGIQDNGVMKFDGTNWKQYSKKTTGLPTNTIRDIIFDKNGIGWFATPKGVLKYDGAKWEIYSLKGLFQVAQLGVFNKLIIESSIQDIAIDHNDVMWIATSNSGVIRVDGEVRTIIATANSPITSDKILNIFIDNQNRKWFATGTFPDDRRSDLYIKNYGAVAQGFTGMVMYKDAKYDYFENWTIINSHTSTIFDNSYYEIAEASNGAMWVSGSGGNKYENKTWTEYQQTGKHNEMLGMAISSTDEVYFASRSRGVYKVEADSIRNYNRDDWGLLNDHLIDLAIDQEDNIWVASIKGLNMCKDGKCKAFTKKTGLLSSNIFSLKNDSKGRVWVCTPKGASVYDHGKWINYSKKGNGLAGYVYDIAEDKEGVFWAATGKGLYTLKGDQWTKMETKSTGINGPKYLIAKCLAFDNDGVLWIGTLTDYLYSFDGKEWKHYNSDNSGIIYKSIRDIELQSNGDIWFTNHKSSSTSSYAGGSIDPNAKPDPSIPIKKSIDDFEPSMNIVILHK